MSVRIGWCGVHGVVRAFDGECRESVRTPQGFDEASGSSCEEGR